MQAMIFSDKGLNQLHTIESPRAKSQRGRPGVPEPAPRSLGELRRQGRHGASQYDWLVKVASVWSRMYSVRYNCAASWAVCSSRPTYT
jgi:hypothetical protein